MCKYNDTNVFSSDGVCNVYVLLNCQQYLYFGAENISYEVGFPKAPSAALKWQLCVYPSRTKAVTETCLRIEPTDGEKQNP